MSSGRSFANAPLVFLCAYILLLGQGVAEGGGCALSSVEDGHTCVGRDNHGADRAVLAAESLLLQVRDVGRSRTTALSSAEDAPASARDGAEVPQLASMEPTVEPSTCAEQCVVYGANHSCSARVQWVMLSTNSSTALDVVNSECEGQCSCSSTDFVWINGDDDLPCRTAQPGERCHKAVEWARTHGIHIHPERFGNLTSGSTIEEFQSWFHSKGLEFCQRPCDVCHTPAPGEDCYEEVLAFLKGGNLSGPASFEEVQEELAGTGSSNCSRPCRQCHTAEEGEMCYNGVMWAMEHGIKVHPEWYLGLSAESSFEDFQERLHRGNFERCPLPCRGSTDAHSQPASTTPALSSTSAPKSTSA